MSATLVPIDPARFEQRAVAIVGTDTGWQKRIAGRIGVDRATVFRWLKRKEAPEMALLALWALERGGTS